MGCGGLGKEGYEIQGTASASAADAPVVSTPSAQPLRLQAVRYTTSQLMVYWQSVDSLCLLGPVVSGALPCHGTHWHAHAPQITHFPPTPRSSYSSLTFSSSSIIQEEPQKLLLTRLLSIFLGIPDRLPDVHTYSPLWTIFSPSYPSATFTPLPPNATTGFSSYSYS